MRSIRRILVVVGATLALSSLVPSVSASSPTPFLLTKTCVSNLLCTVVTSSFDGIPTGTNVVYTVTGDGSDGLAYPTIKVGANSTTGVCDWNQPGPVVLAKCTFGSGTGQWTRFHLDVDVTVAGDPTTPEAVWTWTGTYSLSSQEPPQTDTAGRTVQQAPADLPLLPALAGLAAAIAMLARRRHTAADERARES
jgi:hypothetical protein